MNNTSLDASQALSAAHDIVVEHIDLVAKLAKFLILRVDFLSGMGLRN